MFDLGLDPLTLFVVRLVVVEVVLVSVFAVVIGPRVAARHVRAQAGDVFEERIAPSLRVLVREEVGGLREVVRGELAAVREDAERRIAAAKAEIAAERERVVGELAEEKRRLVEQAAQAAPALDSMTAREMAAKSAEVRRDKAIEREAIRGLVEAHPAAQFVKSVAPAWFEEQLEKGERAIEVFIRAKEMAEKFNVTPGGAAPVVQVRGGNGAAWSRPW